MNAVTAPTPYLEGFRVLDFTQYLAGPSCTRLLAEMGADVIKVEMAPLGDPIRANSPRRNRRSGYFVQQNRGKRSICIDFKSPESVQIVKDLIPHIDVVVENYSAGVMARRGLGYDVLSAINPRLIMARVSGFGQDGPYRDRRSYGRIAEAFGGFAHITGEPDGPPSHSHMSIGDTIGGAWAAMGVMMALYWRDAQGGGVGQVVDLGLYEGLFRQIEQQIVILDQLGMTLGRSGSNHRNVPYTGLFETRDGGYFSFSGVTVKSTTDILRAMGMANDARYNTFAECVKHRDAFAQAVTDWMAARTLAEVDAAFKACDAPGTPVMSAADLIDDPHVLAREMVIRMQDPELGPLRMQGVVPKLTRSPGEVRHAGQPLGASNEDVYRGLLGMSDAELAALREKKVI